VLDPEHDLDPVVAEYEALLDGLAGALGMPTGNSAQRSAICRSPGASGRVLHEAPRDLNVSHTLTSR